MGEAVRAIKNPKEKRAQNEKNKSSPTDLSMKTYFLGASRQQGMSRLCPLSEVVENPWVRAAPNTRTSDCVSEERDKTTRNFVFTFLLLKCGLSLFMLTRTVYNRFHVTLVFSVCVWVPQSYLVPRSPIGMILKVLRSVVQSGPCT